MSPLDPDACYRALLARDVRFDGLLFVGVKTTGVYCRPICPARSPGRDRCLFFRTAAQAESAGFRSCFRCRPELAPGAAPVDALSRVVRRALARIEEGALADGATIDTLATSLGVSARHLRRAMKVELGVGPLAVAASRRLALARQLIVDTALPMTEIALGSGFRSVRRFNAAVRSRYGRPPTAMRRRTHDGGAAAAAITLALPYRSPYDWSALLDYLAGHAIPGVESIKDDTYARTATVGAHRGWLIVAAEPDQRALRATISMSLSGGLMAVVARLRRLFDLDAHPAAIAAHLSRDRRLAPHVRAHPGLRVAGAFDPFEAAARAVLGQQVSVRAGRTILGRLVAQLGVPIDTPHPELTRLFPDAITVAGATARHLATLGVPAARANTLRTVAGAISTGTLPLDVAEPARLVEEICALPGVGHWTAHCVAMRGLGWPDAFPEDDLVLRRALGGVTGRQARAVAERWRPWRAYGATHLWTGLGTGLGTGRKTGRAARGSRMNGATPP